MNNSTRILVVDDDASALRSFSKLLKEAGYEVLEAGKGQEGLELIQNLRPQVALLDVMLPDLSGVEVCRRVKGEAGLGDTFVVLMSGAATRGGRKSLGLDEWADAYMLKASDGEEFLARIRTFVRLQATSAQLKASERNYRQLAENIREVFWISDTAKKEIIYISPGYEDVWGRTCESLYASPRNWIEAVHPEDRERVLAAALTKQSAGQYHETYRIQRPDGSIRWIEDRAFPIQDEFGAVTRVVGIADDITARKRTERRTEAISEMRHRISTAQTREQVAEIIFDVGTEFFGWEAGYVNLCSPGEDQMIPLLTVDMIGNERQRFFSEPALRERSPLMRRVMKHGAELLDPQKAAAAGLKFVAFGNVGRRAASMMFAPIHASGAVIGLVSIQSYTPKAYRQEDLAALQTLADIGGSAFERLEMTEALRRAEAKYRGIFEHATEGIFQTTFEGRYLNANPALALMFGYSSPEELMVSVTNIEQQTFVSSDRSQELKRLLTVQDRALAFEAERFRKDGSKFWTSINVVKVCGEDGSLQYYEGTVQDITKRKRAENENVALSRLGYGLSAAITAKQAAHTALSVALELFGWDAGYVDLYSKAEDKVTSVLAMDTVENERVTVVRPVPQDPSPLMRLVMAHGPQLFQGTNPSAGAPALTPFGDVNRRSASRMFAVIRAGDEVFGSLSIQSYNPGAYSRVDLELLQTMADCCADTFRRIQASEALREAELKYRSIFENATEGIFQTTPDGRFLAANPALARMLGYESADEMKARVANIPEQLYVYPERRIEFTQALEAEHSVEGFEAQGYRQDGARIWVSVSARAVCGENGQVQFYEGTARDITARKQSEEQLRKLSRAVEQSPAIVIITDLQGNIEHVNAKFTEITGYKLEEVRGRNPRLLKSGWTPLEGYDRLWQTITSGSEWRGEFHNRKKDGTFYWESASISPILDPNGRITHFVSVKEDITERKRMEQKLVAFTNLGHRLSAATGVEEAARIILGIAGDLFGWDSGFVHLYSQPEDTITRVLTMDTINGQRVTTPPAPRTAEPSPMMRLVMRDGPRLINRLSDSDPGPILYRFGNQTRSSASMMYAPIRTGGDVVGIMSIQSYTAKAYAEPDLQLMQVMADHCGDALQRIKVAEALRDAELKYRSIFENATEGIFQSTPDGRLIGANPALARMFGYASPEEMMSGVIEIQQQLYVAKEGRATFRNALESQGSIRGFEAENYRKDGGKIWISINARVVRDASGQIRFYEGTIQDITRSKEAEAVLRDSERKLRLISENSTDAIFAFDIERRPVYANPAAAWLTGYTFAEIQQRGFVNWIHPDDQEQMLKLWEELYAGKGYSDVEFRLITKAGQMKWCSSTWGPLFDETGRQIGVQGRERDVSQRKQLESEILEISSTERRRIGHELHDGLGQYLAGISFRAKALEQQLSTAGLPHAVHAKELVGLMSQAISQTRNLARGMAPVDVEVSGLAAALQNLAAETNQLFNTSCQVWCTNSELQVDAQVGLELFRITQEAVRNAIEHGEASKIEIRLNVENQTLLLRITDDGKGFDTENKNVPGMGLRVMGYRARSIGGSLKLNSQAGVGTEVSCGVPLACVVPAGKGRK